jgi:hypothetical protein
MVRRGMFEPMGLADILARIDRRLSDLDLTDNAAQKMAKKPGAISNLRAAVRKGGRSGISTATLNALAPVLRARPEWLLTGEGEMDEADAARLATRIQGMAEGDAVELLTWCFQMLEQAPKEQALVAARAVLRAYRTPQSAGEAPLDSEAKRRLVELAIRLVRQPER